MPFTIGSIVHRVRVRETIIVHDILKYGPLVTRGTDGSPIPEDPFKIKANELRSGAGRSRKPP